MDREGGRKGKPKINIHDLNYTHADRAEIYDNVVCMHKSYMANKEAYARVPMKGMPNPVGKVYRG